MKRRKQFVGYLTFVLLYMAFTVTCTVLNCRIPEYGVWILRCRYAATLLLELITAASWIGLIGKMMRKKKRPGGKVR